MDIATLLGLISGIAIVLLAILIGSDFWIFLNVPGLLIVVGGTFAATLIKFPLATVFTAFFEGIRAAFGSQHAHPRALVDEALELTRLNRRQGTLALEDADIRDPFMRKGIQLLVDGFEPEMIRKTLSSDMNMLSQRQEVAEKVFRAFGDSAPAFGLIGTLVGLVQMLAILDDPSSIGPGMAVALLTTLYGALIANLVANPIADKLEIKAEQERTNRALIIEAVMQIMAGQRPEPMQELLEAYLPEKQRTHDDMPGVVAGAAG